MALAMLAGAPAPVSAKPIASGSNCTANWVNNAGAMACFIQGEDESHAGAAHPHYVACAGGDVFCCVDDDHGNQDCVAQAAHAHTSQASLIKGILAAHKAMTMSLGRYNPPKGAVSTTGAATLQSKAPSK
jgi:hypothetical protein